MNRNGPVLLLLGTVFPATLLHLTLRAVCECRASLLQPSTSLWHSLLEYHLSDQPCQSFHSSSSRAYMKIASVPRATTAASGNWSVRKTNTAWLVILAARGARWVALLASDYLLWSPKWKRAGKDSLEPVLGLLPCPSL